MSSKMRTFSELVREKGTIKMSEVQKNKKEKEGNGLLTAVSTALPAVCQMIVLLSLFQQWFAEARQN